jgi:DNA-binding transcriptional LysR family regulator
MAKIVDWDRHIGRRLRLRDLHVFFVVVQTGSLAKAAAQLNVSQPAISQLIADLEHALSVKLFDRNTRGVTLTHYGHAVLTRGRAAFDELKQGIREIEFLSDPDSGEVKFGCPEGIAPILPPIIESFSQRHPKIILDIYEEEFASFAAKLRNRSLDFVLQRLHGRPRSGDHTFDDLNVETLFDDELVVVVGMKNPLSHRRKIDLAELVDEQWILANPPSWNHKIVSEAYRLRGLRMPKVVLSTFSTHIRASMVDSGRFISTFPKSVARFYAKRFRLKMLQIELPVRPWPVAILTLKNRTMSPVAHLFIDHVRKSTASIYVGRSVSQQ